MHTVARRLLGPDRLERRRRRVTSFVPVEADVGLLLSALAWSGTKRDREAALRSFQAGTRRLPSEAGQVTLTDRREISVDAVDRALTALEPTSPAVRERLLEACAECVIQDGQVARVELELLRAISEALDCPIPPLLPEAPSER